MNNREIVDYILSNKLTQDNVIKRIDKDKYIMYLYNDEFDLWNVNGNVSIFAFCDNSNQGCVFEVISKGQAEMELQEKEKKEKIERLERELRDLKESGE